MRVASCLNHLPSLRRGETWRTVLCVSNRLCTWKDHECEPRAKDPEERGINGSNCEMAAGSVKVVDSIRALGTHRLLLSISTQPVENGESCYVALPDSRNRTRQFLFHRTSVPQLVQPTDAIVDRVMMDCLYGQCESMKGESDEKRQMLYAALAQTICFEVNLHSYLLDLAPELELRMADDFQERHGFRNSQVYLVDTMPQLTAIAASYSSSALRGEHDDHACLLLPVPLKTLVGLSYTQFSKFITDALLERDAMHCGKLYIHFHVEKILWPGIRAQWKSPSHMADSDPARLRFLYDLAHLDVPEDIGILLTIQREKSRMVLDVPGGKRNLGETSLECAYRETWEEVGIDLSDSAVGLGWTHDRTRSTTPAWTIVHHHTMMNMSSFVAYGSALMAMLRLPQPAVEERKEGIF